jgi:co-chaperonin GroES (HSP10)
MMLKAIADRIIVRLDAPEPSSVIMPEKMLTTRHQGIVESTGPLVSGVQIGDHIVFHQFDELELPQKDLVVIRTSSVLAKYE